MALWSTARVGFPCVTRHPLHTIAVGLRLGCTAVVYISEFSRRQKGVHEETFGQSTRRR